MEAPWSSRAMGRQWASHRRLFVTSFHRCPFYPLRHGCLSCSTFSTALLGEIPWTSTSLPWRVTHSIDLANNYRFGKRPFPVSRRRWLLVHRTSVPLASSETLQVFWNRNIFEQRMVELIT